MKDEDKLEIRRADPILSDAPRYPKWEVKSVTAAHYEESNTLSRFIRHKAVSVKSFLSSKQAKHKLNACLEGRNADKGRLTDEEFMAVIAFRKSKLDN